MNTQLNVSPLPVVPETCIESKLKCLGKDIENLDAAITSLINKIRPVSLPLNEKDQNDQANTPRAIQSEVASAIERYSECVNALSSRIQLAIDKIQC